jgi:hypothetical protein
LFCVILITIPTVTFIPVIQRTEDFTSDDFESITRFWRLIRNLPKQMIQRNGYGPLSSDKNCRKYVSYENNMHYSVSVLRENHIGRTSGLYYVPTRMCGTSMIGISNNRSAGMLHMKPQFFSEYQATSNGEIFTRVIYCKYPLCQCSICSQQSLPTGRST